MSENGEISHLNTIAESHAHHHQFADSLDQLCVCEHAILEAIVQQIIVVLQYVVYVRCLRRHLKFSSVRAEQQLFKRHNFPAFLIKPNKFSPIPCLSWTHASWVLWLQTSCNTRSFERSSTFSVARQTLLRTIWSSAVHTAWQFCCWSTLCKKIISCVQTCSDSTDSHETQKSTLPTRTTDAPRVCSRKGDGTWSGSEPKPANGNQVRCKWQCGLERSRVLGNSSNPEKGKPNSAQPMSIDIERVWAKRSQHLSVQHQRNWPLDNVVKRKCLQPRQGEVLSVHSVICWKRSRWNTLFGENECFSFERTQNTGKIHLFLLSSRLTEPWTASCSDRSSKAPLWQRKQKWRVNVPERQGCSTCYVLLEKMTQAIPGQLLPNEVRTHLPEIVFVRVSVRRARSQCQLQ